MEKKACERVVNRVLIRGGDGGGGAKCGARGPTTSGQKAADYRRRDRGRETIAAASRPFSHLPRVHEGEWRERERDNRETDRERGRVPYAVHRESFERRERDEHGREKERTRARACLFCLLTNRLLASERER